MSEGPPPTVADYIAMAPTDAAWAARAAAPYAAMTPAERLRQLSILNGWMDALLNGRMPEREDGELPFWMLWKDPTLGGRPR